jgi:hypothetical protein
MVADGAVVGRRGRIARASVCAAALLLGACASAPKTATEVHVRPAPQTMGGHQVVGEAIVTSLGGASAMVRWLPPRGVQTFYAQRPGLTVPWPEETWRQSPPTVFLLRLRNVSREEVQFDPALVALATPDGRRERPIPYEEMYMRMAGRDDPVRIRSLEATLFSRFVVIPPGGQREGLLIFPMLDPKTKHLLLELSSFFVGGRLHPGLFEFQVLRTEKPEEN